MMPQLTCTEHGTDPMLLTPVRTAGDLLESTSSILVPPLFTTRRLAGEQGAGGPSVRPAAPRGTTGYGELNRPDTSSPNDPARQP
jgi:hypothetical protein